MAQTTHNDAYSCDEAFWNNYVRGRPQVPPSLFERVRDYHASHGGSFDVVHDVGAGPGIHAVALRKLFAHVIESDVVESSIELARKRLGDGDDSGFSYRTEAIESADDLAPASVDCVFAATMMHFADLDRAYAAIGHQLKPGGTLAIFAAGRQRLSDERADAAWQRIAGAGVKALVDGAGDRELMIRRFGRGNDGYDSIYVDGRYFLPGALRIRFNREEWGFAMPDEIRQEYREKFGASAIKPDEQVSVVQDDGWSFKTDIDWIKATFDSLPLGKLDPALFASDWKELEEILGDRTMDATWEARLILATRR